MSRRKLKPIEKLINKLFAKESMVPESTLEHKIIAFSSVSVSYFMLHTASVIIATMGLLMNASAIVIGSMIISPLTWPMFSLADGAALGNRKRIRNNLMILIASIVYGILLAYILTLFSPLKVVNSEILARSQPTLLDAVVALTAGAIGALAIVRKNISDTVAGVAVALSLTPPLCVLGISLALNEASITTGSFLLLLTNALSITFIGGVIFILVHYSWRRHLRMAPRAFAVMLISLLVTAIPLYELLNNYSFETSSYAIVQNKLETFVSDIAPNASVQNIKTSLEEESGQGKLVVEADMFVPTGTSVTIEDKDRLIDDLSSQLNRIIDLRLKVQNISLLANAEDIALRDQLDLIRSSLREYFLDINQTLTISEVQANSIGDTWKVSAQVSGYQSSAPSATQVNQAEDILKDVLGQNVELRVSYLPLVEIGGESQTSTNRLRRAFETILARQPISATIESIALATSSSNAGASTIVTLELKAPVDFNLNPDLASELKEVASQELASLVELRVLVLRFEENSF